MNKLTTLQVSGATKIPHSKKLEWALRDFITSNNGSYYDDEINKGIIKSYFRLEHGICVEQKVQIRKESYICHTTLSCHAKPENKETLIKYVLIANSINIELDYGCFEVDTKTGEIRFKCCYEPDDKVFLEGLDKLLGYPTYIINKYGHRFAKVNSVSNIGGI